MGKKSLETPKAAPVVEEQKPEEPKPESAQPEQKKTMIAQLVEQELTPERMKMLSMAGADKLISGLMSWADAIEKAVIQQGEALNALGQNIKPVVEFAQKVNQAQSQGRAPNNGGMGNIGDIVTIVKEAIAGGSAPNPLQDKMNEFMTKTLDKAIARIDAPSASETFSRLLDEELLKAKAKAAAAVVSAG